LTVRICDEPLRLLQRRAGVQESVDIHDIVVQSGRRPHGLLYPEDDFGGKGRAASDCVLAPVSGQAALESI